MADYLAALYQLIGSLLAPLVNGLTEWLNGFLPIDLAKAITVIALYLVAMTVIKYLPQHLERGLTRAFVVLAIAVRDSGCVSLRRSHHRVELLVW